MKALVLLGALIVAQACSNSLDVESKPFAQSRISVIYNTHSNRVLGNTIFLKDLGNIDMTLHELGHIMEFKVRSPQPSLVRLLQREYPIPPSIKPSINNEELQDFITTSTRWKVVYPFKHKEEGTLIVSELLANLFVIFTRRGPELDYIEKYYPEIYIEYGKYYNSLRRDRGTKIYDNNK